MTVDELLDRARETLSGRRVYGEPVEHEGVLVIPAAAVLGGGGGGSGQDEDGQQGLGGGFGLWARPSGVHVVRGGIVRWQPAIDVNRLFTTMATVVIASLWYRWRMASLATRHAAAPDQG